MFSTGNVRWLRIMTNNHMKILIFFSWIESNSSHTSVIYKMNFNWLQTFNVIPVPLLDLRWALCIGTHIELKKV